MLTALKSVIIILPLLYSTQILAQRSSYDLNSKPFQERHRFESLLAAGRTLAFPYTTGLILTVISSQRENWNVSLQGLSEIMDLSPDQLCTTYTDSMNLIKQDDNVTMSSNLYLLQNQKIELASATNLDKLQIEVQPVMWDADHFNTSWDLMNANLNEKTNNLMDGKLIPKDSIVGNPFRFSTQALVTSTFHYKNSWENAWASDGLGKFGNAENVPFIHVEGEFLFSDADDYSAISVPLKGNKKSVVFIQPKINFTQYLLHLKRKVLLTGRIRGGENEEGDDFVPFPRIWEKRDLSVHIPSFTLTTTDQYGKELGELGMNQTFCTTLRDKSGTIPFYMRPIVQVNTVSVTDAFVEIASATGTAVEKFYFGIDLAGVGYPKSEPTVVNHNHDDKMNPSTISDKLKSLHSGDEPSLDAISGFGETNIDTFDEMEDSVDSITTTVKNEVVNKEKFVFDKPFIWYLNDATLGPMFYGIVEQTGPEEMPDLDENSRFGEETQKFLLWSCRSFKQSGEQDV